MEARKEQLLTTEECAELLRISRATLSRLLAKGAIGFYRVGFRTMFSEEHIETYLKSVEGNRELAGVSDEGEADESEQV